MTVIARDEFTYSAPPSSGAADFTTVDNTAVFLYMDSNGSPAASDQVEYTLTFPGGTVTIRARWSTTSTLLLERISTIAGTSNGTATLATITGTSTSKPRTTGDLVRIRITVNRGVANASTTIGWGWAARSSTTEQNSGTFNVDGELTPSAGAFTVSGSSFQNRPDLEGTTPDTVALGTWARVSQISSQPQIDKFGTESDGICRPQRLGSNEVIYALQGTGASGNYTVRASGVFVSGASPGLEIAGRLSGSAGTLAGYVIVFGGPDLVEIQEWAAGSFDSSLDFEFTPADYDDEVAHTVEAIFADDVCTVTLDGVTVATATGLTTLVGDPGLGGYRSSLDVAGFGVEWWEIDDAAVTPPPPPNPCVVEIARDDFTDSAADLDAEPLTSPTSASWQAHPASVGTVQKLAGYAVAITSGRTIHLARSTGVGPDYCVQPCPTFPAVPTIGTPGYGAWRYKIWGGDSATVLLEEGLVADILGTNTFYGLIIGGLTVYPNGQPHTWSQENTGALGVAVDFRDIEFYATAYLSSGGLHTWPWRMDYEVTADPTLTGDTPPGYNGIGGPYRINGLPVSGGDSFGFDPASVNFVPSAQNYADGILPYTHPYPPFYFPRGNPGYDERDRTSAGSTALITLRLGGGGASGTVSIEMSELKVDGTTSIPSGGVAGTADGGGEFASAAALVCYDEAADSGYRADLIFDHTGAPIVGSVKLECLDAGTPTLMREWSVAIAHNAEYTPVLRVQDTVLVVEYEGDVLGTFDVATDTADETSALVTDYTGSGFPGAAFRDASTTGDYMTVDRVVIYNGCTGGPENPYPPNPPPTEPTELLKIWVQKLGIARPVRGPGSTDPSKVFAGKAGIGRRITGVWVQQGGIARPILAAIGEQPPPPNTSLPPYLDLCEILDPGVDLPPIGAVVPIPSVAGRSFGMGPMPVTLFGDVLNASQRPVGSWTAAELAVCAARGATIFGATGGYDKFISSGYYRQILMDDWIANICTNFGSVLLAGQADGSFGGMIPLDDFKVQHLWPTSPGTGGGDGHGLSDAEVERIIAVWHSYLPTLVVGVRERPTLSSGYAGATVYVAQYPGPYAVGKQIGDTITATDFRNFRDTELAQAASFGADIVVNLQPNFLHGGSVAGYSIGDSWPNPYMTPAQLLVCSEGWYQDGGGTYVDRIYSSTGFMYRPEYVALTGMWDALATMHNDIMSLPPL